MTKQSRRSSLVQTGGSHSHSHCRSHSHTHSLFHRLRQGAFHSQGPAKVQDDKLGKHPESDPDQKLDRGESELDSDDSLAKRNPTIPIAQDIAAHALGDIADTYSRIAQHIPPVNYLDPWLPPPGQPTVATSSTSALGSASETTATLSASNQPSSTPSNAPSSTPSNAPSSISSNAPSSTLSNAPSSTLSNAPSSTLSSTPSSTLSSTLPSTRSNAPSSTPSNTPSSTPSSTPLSTAPGSSRTPSSSSGTVHTSSNDAKVTPVASPSSPTTDSALPSAVDHRNATVSTLHANFSSTASTDTYSSSLHRSTSTSYSGPVSLHTSEHQSTSVTVTATATGTATETAAATGTAAATAAATTKNSSSSPASQPHATGPTTIATTIITEISSTKHPASYSTPFTTDPSDGYNILTVPGSLPSGRPKGAFSGDDEGGGGAVPLSPQQKQVIGGVVGSIAGIAVIGLLLMFFLRYKKRKGSGFLLDSQSGTTTRSLGGFQSGGGSGAAMAERSAASAAVASALASLTGKRTSPDPVPAAADERGFYRVAGRKLPSVLQSGGDGYTDPRASAASGNSDYYRGSQAFDPASNGSGQLALGAPMRPVSGSPVMRSGPARVAVTESPFIDPPYPITPTSLSPRTLPSRDSLRGSGSRFHESF
ncbi:hypothetical protein E4U42_002382 [Claviceps africana]|uniref:Mid2 domain-containing protein n=1 Tax=Claviceps africana TaxID=83212 RepID=A0A8K0J8D5_9HYPO|nr:hypothetical protein E4U42_002382 [Claviceps africana]